jgi:hypothetical protein
MIFKKDVVKNKRSKGKLSGPSRRLSKVKSIFLEHVMSELSFRINKCWQHTAATGVVICVTFI